MGKNWIKARTTTLKKLVTPNRMGLITDMDGTISHIVANPEDAVVTPRNYELLQQLREKLTLVSVVSGRSVRSVTTRLDLPGIVYIGNHGLERCVNGQVRHSFNIDRFRPMLKASAEKLKQIPLYGIQVEDKGATVTLHYRQTEDTQQTRYQLLPIVQKIAAQHNLEYFEGRMIFELCPPVEANKGSAFEELVNEFSLDSAIYIGDDTTDLTALKMAQQLRLERTCYAIGVGVMSENSPAGLAKEADLLASGVPDVENLLAWILENRN